MLTRLPHIARRRLASADPIKSADALIGPISTNTPTPVAVRLCTRCRACRSQSPFPSRHHRTFRHSPARSTMGIHCFAFSTLTQAQIDGLAPRGHGVAPNARQLADVRFPANGKRQLRLAQSAFVDT